MNDVASMWPFRLTRHHIPANLRGFAQYAGASFARPNRRTVCRGYRTLWQNTMSLLRISIAVIVLTCGPSLANHQASPEFGTCQVCCSAYPSGWRGMCVRRCHAYRQGFPRAERLIMPCECSLNRRRDWSCSR
jgi:hypothetical protein